MKKLSDYITLYPKQKQVLSMIGTGAWIFFGGARGGGKSYLALAACFIVALKFPGIKCIIIRKTFPELNDNFIDKLFQFPAEVFGYKHDKKNNRLLFKNGSIIGFKPLESKRDIDKVLGVEFQFVVIDEANNYDDDTIYRIIGSLRATTRLKGFIPTLLMTGNPGGMADHFFKTHYIHPDYSRWDARELKNKHKYKFVFSTVADNPSVTPEYRESLDALPDELRRAWLDGDWNVFSGQYFTEFNENIHVIPDFEIPEDWTRICGIDLGFTKKHPTVCLWAAQNPITLKVYIYREYVAFGSIEMYIRDIEELSKGEEISCYFADPSMWGNNHKREESDQSSAQLFYGEGMPLVPANHDRITGWTLLKQWLNHNQHVGKEPLMYFFESCQVLITTFPTLVYVSSTDSHRQLDLDSKGADDAADALRYLTISGLQLPTYSMQKLLQENEERVKSGEAVPDLWLRDKATEKVYTRKVINALY